jgi:hypothetical protein
MNQEICCPEFNPAPWEEQTLQWENKKFIRDKVFTLFYMPLNFGKVMKRLDHTVRNAAGTIPDHLCLSDHTSKWNMNVYLAVDKDIPAANNVTLSGHFFSKVYEGPYKDTRKWCQDFESMAKNKGLNIRKQYMWYTTCPKCAKKYGKNYVVIIAQT